MNIESSKVSKTLDSKVIKANNPENNESSVKFSDELKELEQANDLKKEADENSIESSKVVKDSDSQNCSTKVEGKDFGQKTLDDALDDLNNIMNKFHQSEDKTVLNIKDKEFSADNNNVINKDFNIQENKDLLPQMNPNMNFSGNGQPFSSFMNNEQSSNSNQQLSHSAKDLAEEAAILSTMAENIAMANKNEVLQNSEKTVVRNEGVKKVDSKTGITTETVVKFDSIIMNQADVEVFANIVEKGSINMDSLTTESVQKSVQISKTLADMLVKARETSQPLRIDFDNNISVIIRISRDGKLSADFLPSSQVAEAYLKENLPLLRQRFDEKNIEYDSLNQRERRDSQREQNRKKGRNDE